MNGQQSFQNRDHNGYQRVTYRGGPGNWGSRGSWGHHSHHGSPLTAILLFLLAIFILSKAWWLIFVLPGMFFWLVGGSKTWSAGAWDDCESPRKVKVEKRKNDDFYGEDEDSYFDDKPKRQNDQQYEIV